MYSRNSRVKFGKTLRKLKALTITQKADLKDHKETHTICENPKEMVDKHMKVMSDLMKGGDSFEKSHIEAQKLYPMKFCNSKQLKDFFIAQSFTVEQDDVPALLLKLRKQFEANINSLDKKGKQFIMEDDNFF